MKILAIQICRLLYANISGLETLFNSPAALRLYLFIQSSSLLDSSRNRIWEWLNGQDRYLAGMHVTGRSFFFFCFSCFFSYLLR